MVFSSISRSILLLSMWSFASAQASPPVVDLGYAQYEGASNATTHITEFLGIRYAKPPTGALRFQAPRSPTVAHGVQLATTRPNTCVTGNEGQVVNGSTFLKRDVGESEDCLFLSVYAPSNVALGAKLPVVVWFPGGGYVEYFPSSNFDGGSLVEISEPLGGAIAVIVQYRLGLYGFLASRAVKQKGALNAGLLDQRLALQWVQAHISKFGGDPSQVTIWGQSAGAGSVLQHIVADGGNTQPPLFRNALSSSLYAPPQYNFNDSVPETIYAAAVEQAGCAGALDQFACLQTTDSVTLAAVNFNATGSAFKGTFNTVPVVDGSLIRDRPSQILAEGIHNGKLLLAVTNTFEGSLLITPDVLSNGLAYYVSHVFPKFGQVQISRVVDTYTSLFDNITDQAIAVVGESIFICPTYYLMPAFGSKAYKGEFAVPPGEHGQDVPYYFPSAGSVTYNNSQFATSFTESFLAIVTSSNPNATPDSNNITPDWAPWAVGNTEMLFNRTEAGAPDIRPIKTDAAFLARCGLWRDLSAYIGQ